MKLKPLTTAARGAVYVTTRGSDKREHHYRIIVGDSLPTDVTEHGYVISHTVLRSRPASTWTLEQIATFSKLR